MLPTEPIAPELRPRPGALMTLSMACVPSWQLRQASETDPTTVSSASKVAVFSVE